jgi:WD40 repeat protein
MNLLEKCNPNLKGHSSIVLCTIPIDNKRIATGSLDKTIRIWNDSQSIKLLTGHNGAVNQLILHSATLMISCSDDKELRLWDLKAYVCIKRFLGHTAPVTSLCSVSPDLCHKYFSEPK